MEPEYPCEPHAIEMATIRALAEGTKTELAVMQEVLRRMDKMLFGNGKPGVIDELKQKDEELQKKVNSHDRLLWVGLGIVLTMQFLSGSGLISLKGFIGH